MRFTGSLAAVAPLALHFATAAFAAPPSIDIQSTCRTAAGAMVRLMGGSSMERDIEVCLSSENGARDQLVKDWATYSGTDRERCIRTAVYLPSYVEWITCLEMERDVRKMRQQEQAVKSNQKR